MKMLSLSNGDLNNIYIYIYIYIYILPDLYQFLSKNNGLLKML